MLKICGRICRKVLSRNSIGATMIEVLMAVVVLGLVVAAVPPVMVLVSNAQVRQNELRIGQNFTRSQFEFIKSQTYNPDLLAPEPYKELPDPPGYVTQTLYFHINPDSGNITSDTTTGVEMIEVLVFGYHLTSEQNLISILDTKSYKVDRSLEISGWEVYR